MLTQKRAAKIKPAEAIVLIVVLVLGAGYLGIINLNSLSGLGSSGTSTNNNTGVNTNQNANCVSAPIESELTSSNAQTVTSPTVATYQMQSSGNYLKFTSVSGSLTQNTLNTASAYTNYPVVQVYNGTAVYPLTVTTAPGASAVDPATGLNTLSTTCAPAAGGSNTVNVLQAIATVFTGPASGTTAVTNVENVINSATSQTNSFPAAMPTASPATVTDYLQIFSANTVAGRSVQLPASSNTPITNYGGENNQGPTSTLVKGGMVYYQASAVVSFNQTAIAFTGPTGTIPLTLHGATGSVAFLVPLTCYGPSPASGVSSTNPYVGCTFSYQVQETTSATGHHIDMAVLVVDNTQIGYIEQYFNAPAVTSYHAAGNTFGITGFTGLFPPTSANGPHQIIEQQSYVIATY